MSAFPHHDDDMIRDIGTIYDHIFELSRYFIEFSGDCVFIYVAQFIVQVWYLSGANPKASSIASTANQDLNTSDLPPATKSSEMAFY